ncbi:MAG: esterase-like activity of phytase family protein [Paracoccaceae bacterium]
MHRRLAVALILSCLSFAPAWAEPKAELIGTYRWEVEAKWFGGISGLELASDGRRFYAVSDRGSLLLGEFERDDDVLNSVHLIARVRLKQSKNDPLTGRFRDAEGIALRDDGSFCISFEHTHRTGCYAFAGAPPVILPEHPDFKRLHENSTLEALAVDGQNRLLTIPENAPTPTGPFPAYRWENGAWSVVFHLPREGSFLPVGADFGPDGRLYLLERDAAGIGFRTRIRSWKIRTDQPQDEQTHLETFYLVHGNLEGLSVWQDERGRVRFTLVADNNFMDLLRTEIVEYAMPALAKGRATH